MLQRRAFQRFVRRGRPPWHQLPDDAVLVVALPQGLTVDDRLLPCGALVPRERFQESQLRALYDWKRIDVGSATSTVTPPLMPAAREPEAKPLPLGAAINASRGPARAPVSSRR